MEGKNKEIVVAMPYFSNGGGCKFPNTKGKCPCFPASYYKGMSGIGARPFIMEIEDMNEYIKKDKDEPLALTFEEDGSDNQSDIDSIWIAIRGRESACLTTRRTEYGKQIRKQYEAGEISEQRKNIQRLEPRKDGKTNCLTTVNKDNMIMEMNAVSCAMRQRDGAKLELRSDSKANALLAANRTKSMVAERTDGSMRRINNNICSEDSKTHTFLASSFKGAAANGMTLVNRKFRIRRLTPKECARLQTIPDWYEWKGKFPDGKVKDTSDTQIYKMCGNGWCVEVIKHIFNYLPR